MGLNRILMKANGSTIEGDGGFIMTMGQQSIQYAGGYLDFAFNVEGVTGGRYNVTVKVTSVETNTSVTIEFPDIQYQSYVPGFYEYTNSLPSDVARMFSSANVGKKFKVEIIFN